MVKHIKRETNEESSDSHQLLSFSKLGLLLKVRIFFPGGTDPDFRYYLRRETRGPEGPEALT